MDASEEHLRVDRLKWLLMFVVAWLIALYIYEVVGADVNRSLGFVVAAATLGLNMYARHRVLRSVQSSLTTTFWLFLPVVMFVVVPVVSKVITFLRADEGQTWWDHFFSLLPFILKLGVPVGVLLVVYFTLGRLGPTAEEGAEPESSTDLARETNRQTP